MTKRSSIKTTHKQIIDYWETIVDYEDLGANFEEAHERCWRCGYKSTLHRCHIIPDSLGGEDAPSNLVLLCNRCHREAPNIDNAEFFWDWLIAQRDLSYKLYDSYWTFRGMKEYEDIYKETITTTAKNCGLDADEVKEYILDRTISAKTTVHFGEGRLNPATIAGILRAFIKLKAPNYKYENIMPFSGFHRNPMRMNEK